MVHMEKEKQMATPPFSEARVFFESTTTHPRRWKGVSLGSQRCEGYNRSLGFLPVYFAAQDSLGGLILQVLTARLGWAVIQGDQGKERNQVTFLNTAVFS